MKIGPFCCIASKKIIFQNYEDFNKILNSTDRLKLNNKSKLSNGIKYVKRIRLFYASWGASSYKNYKNLHIQRMLRIDIKK